MPRYFLEVAYVGTNYSGFQVQENANSIQQEIERSFEIFFRRQVTMTGSSRTDAGVHALQNFFHFDFEDQIASKSLYNLNALLPEDIVIRNLYQVHPEAHCRFDSLGRHYRYYIHQTKDPFLKHRAYHFPYTLDFNRLQAAAATVPDFNDFTSFSKRNTQVRSFICAISQSHWEVQDNCWVYHVAANRFLRGMVRGLVGTMLQVGRGKIGLDEFAGIIAGKDCALADFSVPPHGLFLEAVIYEETLLSHRI